MHYEVQATQTQGAKVGASISASRYRMQQQHATTTITTTDHADAWGPTIHPTNLGLMQVAVITASCCVGHICMVGGGGGCSCILFCIPYWLALMLVTTFAPCILTFAPYILTFVPYILTFGPCACGVSLSADSPLANVVVSPSATCTGGAFPSSHWSQYCTCQV